MSIAVNKDLVEIQSESPLISFYADHDWDETKRFCIGNLWTKDNQIYFEGNLHQSAKEFFDYVQYLSSK